MGVWQCLLAILGACISSVWAQAAPSCDAQNWKVCNARLQCASIGSRRDVLQVSDAGGWSHAYLEVNVSRFATYRLTGSLYAEEQGVCDSSAKVIWCSPSVVVCSGPYDGEFYNHGGCLVGIAAMKSLVWEDFDQVCFGILCATEATR